VDKKSSRGILTNSFTSWTRTSISGSKRQAQRTTFHFDRDKKKKEERELGVGAHITDCLLTKPSWLSLLQLDYSALSHPGGLPAFLSFSCPQPRHRDFSVQIQFIIIHRVFYLYRLSFGHVFVYRETVD